MNNDKTPFRGAARSPRDWFTEYEQGELIALPQRRWESVVWRKAKVHRDWHIQLDTIKYSVPCRFSGLGVDVRIIGDKIDVLTDGEIIATHLQGPRRDGVCHRPGARARPSRDHLWAVDPRVFPPPGRSAPAPSRRSPGCWIRKRSRRRATGRA